MKKLFLFNLLIVMCINNNFAQTWNVSSGSLYTSPNTTKIGIGVNAPQSLLQILKTPGSTSGKGLLFGYYGNDIQGRSGTSGQYNGDLILNYWSGNVGIGTLSPSQKLDVIGNIKTSGSLEIGNTINMNLGKWIGFGASGEGNNRLYIHHNSTHGYIDFKDNLHFRADKNWISALTLYGDGSVGVGFNSTYNEGEYLTQGYKLAVNGKILCEGIEGVADVPNSDFVFEEDYELLSLEEVEKFVKENKHLPEIQSAEYFKKNGYNMNKFDDLLLRKIEQLTLYIIEQNKKIETLEEQLNGQSK